MLVIGIFLVMLKLAGVSPVEHWSWWWLALPFAAAVVWWSVADATGLTARREMSQWAARREERRRAALVRPSRVRPGEARHVQREDPTGRDGP